MSDIDILEINDLSVSFDTDMGELQAVRGVSFSLKSGEILAIVGESGCGKSVLCKSIMKLLPKNAYIKSGSIIADNTDITSCSERDMQKLRGKLFSVMLQDPMTALDPTMSVGKQIAETVLLHSHHLSRKEAHDRSIELMQLVGIDGQQHFRQHPHTLSGGQRARIAMAIALASDPKILIADEPTASLDVTVQAQILDLLLDLQSRLGTAIIMVSHDLGVVARVADRVAVMYAGRIVEIGTAEEIFYVPRHPYTWGLLRSLPSYAKSKDEMYTIPGMPPVMTALPKGDAFACRNEYALAIDHEQEPPMFRISDTHYAATWLLDARAPKISPPIGGNLHV